MNEEFEKQLCVKVIYGGDLSAEEKPVWDAFMKLIRDSSISARVLRCVWLSMGLRKWI